MYEALWSTKTTVLGDFHGTDSPWRDVQIQFALRASIFFYSEVDTFRWEASAASSYHPTGKLSHLEIWRSGVLLCIHRQGLNYYSLYPRVIPQPS